MNKQRERLYYLFQESKCPMHFLDNKQMIDTTDYLLANGVIVTPCKVGDYVYYVLNGNINKAKIEERKFNDSKHGKYSSNWYIHAYDRKNKLEISFDPDDMFEAKFIDGKWCEMNIYFSREEAENALNNFQNGNSCEGGVQG